MKPRTHMLLYYLLQTITCGAIIAGVVRHWND